MNITRHLYLSTALRAPDDEGGAPEAMIEAPPPAADAASDAPPAAEPAPDATPAAAEPPPTPAPPMVPLRVLQQRIGEEGGKRTAAERRAAEAEARASELQSILERLQAERQTDSQADPTRQAAPRATAPQEQPNLEEAVRRVVNERESARSISDVIQRGVQEFTQAQWDEKANILGALGAASPEFVQDVIAVDAANAHRIIFALAEDPGKAADLAAMNVRQRTAELTRMSMAEQAKTPPAAPAAAPKTPISKAPAPASVPRAHAGAGEVDPTTPEGNDKMSDEQWAKWFKAEGAKKLASARQP